MSINVITQDIVNKVKSIPALEGRVGLALGGKNIDPTLRKLPVPNAWVIYMGDDVITRDEINPCVHLMRINFVVLISHEYQDHSEAELITTDFPILHEVAQAIRGTQPTNLPGNKWVYEGQGLEIIDNRYVWAQQYSITLAV